MLTSSFHNPYDPLQGSGDLVPEPVRESRLVFKIALGVVGGLLLAAAGNLEQQGGGTPDRAALTGAAPQVVAEPQNPWDEGPTGEAGLSH